MASPPGPLSLAWLCFSYKGVTDVTGAFPKSDLELGVGDMMV